MRRSSLGRDRREIVVSVGEVIVGRAVVVGRGDCFESCYYGVDETDSCGHLNWGDCMYIC